MGEWDVTARFEDGQVVFEGVDYQGERELAVFFKVVKPELHVLEVLATAQSEAEMEQMVADYQAAKDDFRTDLKTTSSKLFLAENAYHAWNARAAEVAENAAVHPLTRGRLVRSEDPKIREGAARNPTLNEEELERLLGDKFGDVRMEAAKHPSITETLARRSMWAGDRNLNLGLAANPSLAPSFLEELWGRQATTQSVKVELLGNRNCPATILSQAARGEDPDQAKAAAQNPNLPFEDQKALMANPEDEVRIALASNPSLNPEVAAQLFNDRSFRVQAALRQREQGSPASPSGGLGL